jgi:hypothetical protein
MRGNIVIGNPDSVLIVCIRVSRFFLAEVSFVTITQMRPVLNLSTAMDRIKREVLAAGWAWLSASTLLALETLLSPTYLSQCTLSFFTFQHKAPSRILPRNSYGI